MVLKTSRKKEISIELGVPTHCVQRWINRHRLRKSAEKQLECSKRRYLEINGYPVGSVEACKKRMMGRRGERILLNLEICGVILVGKSK